MRPLLFTRFYRRVILKYFGSLRTFVFWCVAILVTVYTLDIFYFSQDEGAIDTRLQPKDASGKVQKGVCKTQVCPEGQYSYYVKSGLELQGQPTICFNGITVFSPESSHGGRGINMITINEHTLEIIERRNFDTYEDDKIFQRYFRLGMSNNPLIILTTVDDASTHLTDESRKCLELFGSKLASKIGFRDSFALIGQRGLESPAAAVEAHKVRGSNQFADSVELQGCVTVPMGKVRKVDEMISNLTLNPSDVLFGTSQQNCELDKACDADTIPVSLSSGKENIAGPQICYNSQQVIGSGDKTQTLGRGDRKSVV